MDPRKLISDLQKRLNRLKDERQGWMADWKTLAEHFLPRKMFILEDNKDQNKGGLNNTLINGYPVVAMRVLAAGMQGGITSPARPWFKLGTRNVAFQENIEIKNWLGEVQKILLTLLSRSNFYSAIHSIYAELGTFGTGCLFIMEDVETVIRFIPLTAGEFFAAVDSENRVKIVFRLYDLTAEQIVQKFGKEKVSRSVLDSYNRQSGKDNYFTVAHAVLPNPEYKEGVLGYKGKVFLSVYWEYNTKDIRAQYLSIGGFEEQPFAVPRWDVKGQEVYGSSPAMDALPDSKQLQSMTKSLLKYLQKEVDPPMSAPRDLKHASLAPGALNFVDSTGAKFEPAIQLRGSAQGTMISIESVKKSVGDFLYNDLFNMFAGLTRNMTATEIRERAGEKLILLGPVLDRLHSDLLSPVIDRVFSIALRRGVLPFPPEILQGQELKVEYISLLAQAQKLVGISSIEQFMAFVQAGSQTYQEMIDIVNYDEAAEEYADMLGVPPGVVRSQEERDLIREQRAVQQQAILEQQAISQGIEDAKNMSQADLESENALSAIANEGV